MSTMESVGRETSHPMQGRLPLSVLWRTTLKLLWASRWRTWPVFAAISAVLFASYFATSTLLATADPIAATWSAMLLVAVVLNVASALAVRLMLAMPRPWAVSRELGIYIAVGVVFRMTATLLFSAITASFAMGDGMTIAGLLVVLVLAAVLIAIEALSIRLTLWLVGGILSDESISYRNAIARMQGAVQAGLSLWVLVFGGCSILSHGGIWALNRIFELPVDHLLVQTFAVIPSYVLLVGANAALWELRGGPDAMAQVFE